MYSVDPRRTSSSKFADVWLGLDVGTDIAMANAVAREIIHAGLVNQAFINHSTKGFEAYRDSVEPYTLDVAAEITGVPAEAIKDMAHAYATARRRFCGLSASPSITMRSIMCSRFATLRY